MPLDHLANLLALRAVARGLLVATTGATDLAATAEGFTRAAGSFVADGFAVGMEVEPSGFASAAPAVLIGVTPLALYTNAPQVPEAAAAGRSLTVGLPGLRAWENEDFEPVEGRAFMEEDYLPGPEREEVRGVVTGEPMYVLKLYAPSDVGTGGIYRVADALKNRFRPGQQIPLSTGEILHVRTNPAPYRSQLTIRSGRALVTVTIPLRTHSTNLLTEAA